MRKYFFNFNLNKIFLKKNFFKPLYLLNDIRFNYILKRIDIKFKYILDLGCGIGLLSEKLALHGGIVTGIDKSKFLIKIASKNAIINKLNINYICYDFLFIKNVDFKFDLIICTEVLEHINDFFKLLNFFEKISKKNTLIFLSSLNKNFLSYFKIIFLGEFVSKNLNKNTHKYEQFINSFSLKIHLEHFGFIINDIKYLNYNFLFKYAFLETNRSANYLVELVKLK
ncbi:MAG TPA: bifunctional 2-polyprenyl-6-hydroxyphenol methylase/3-demethylubiquinol 3-O-methyltransferase UbiG [Candidatus Azoamicus sp.]